MPNLNVALSDKVYKAMNDMKMDMRSKTWPEFFEKMFLKRELLLEVDILGIKGDRAENYQILFQFGNQRYLYTNNNDTFKLVKKTEIQFNIGQQEKLEGESKR